MRDDKMRKYLERLKHECLLLGNVKIEKISCNNYHAITLAMPTTVHDKKQLKDNKHNSFFFWASTSEVERVINQLEDLSRLWFDLFVIYLSNGDLFEDKKKTCDIVSKSKSYLL